MGFFDGIQFVCCGSSGNSNLSTARQFKDYYGIQYCHENYFQVKMDKKFDRTVFGSWVLITRPGPEFCYGPPAGKTNRHSFVCFKGPRAERYIKNGLLPLNERDPLIRITRPEHFQDTLLKLVDLLTPIEQRTYARAVNMLEDLLLQLHEQPPVHENVPEYLRLPLDELTGRMRAHPEFDWNFEYEAENCGISYPHFRKVFSQLYHLPPGKYLTLQRLKRATAMLRDSDEQIASIAENCGFDDQFYFSRMFKKYYHFSPRRYRLEFR